jgi:hypothetical protein
VLDPATDHDAAELVERLLPQSEELPLVICPDGSVLRNPGDAAVARCIGMLMASYSDRVYGATSFHLVHKGGTHQHRSGILLCDQKLISYPPLCGIVADTN